MINKEEAERKFRIDLNDKIVAELHLISYALWGIFYGLCGILGALIGKILAGGFS